MGQRYPEISDKLAQFIRGQKLFFVATAACDGRINLSPKGMDSLRVLDPHRVVWLNVTGSGNETAAHLLENDRMTLMFCAFEGDPLILRLYGHARSLHPRDPAWNGLIGLFPALPGARQIIDMRVDLVQTSCGMGVPFLDFRSERPQLNAWAERKGADGIRQYWERKNRVSLDGKPTRILDDTPGNDADPG
jgi:hypothetical protein